MKLITYLLALIILSCGSNLPKSKYYNISFESNTNFPKEIHKTSNSMARVDYLEGEIIVDIIRNDSVCSSETFTVKNDTIIGNWYSIEDYTKRLLFPELNIKVSNKKAVLNETGISEIRNEQKWEIYKEWGIGLTSNISGEVEIVDKTTKLKTISSINTPARPFSGKSTTIIKEMEGFEILKFDLKWEDCM